MTITDEDIKHGRFLPQMKANKPSPSKTTKSRTPKQGRELERSPAIADAQQTAGSIHGPFDAVEDFSRSLGKARLPTKRISIQIPGELFDSLEKEAKRFDVTTSQWISTILETHRLAVQDRRLFTLAIAQSAGPLKTGRYEK